MATHKELLSPAAHTSLQRSSIHLLALSAILLAQLSPGCAQQADRATPPTRAPHAPDYVQAKELPDGTVPPATTDGNFILGPTHQADIPLQDHVITGKLVEFMMDSTDSRIYLGIAREPNTFGTPDPNDPAKLVVTTSRPAPYSHKVTVYVPAQYVAGTAAPFIVGADGLDRRLFAALDVLIG